MAAAIERVTITDLGPNLKDIGEDVLGDIKDRALAAARAAGWAWYKENERRVLWSKKILWSTINLRVKDIRFIFVELLGEEVVLTSGGLRKPLSYG